jgi:FkbM family methyltransferase
MSIAPALQANIREYEKIAPAVTLAYDNVPLRYNTPNSTTLWRVATLLTKEPCTIEWLNTIGRDEVLVDVGANVGMYTVFAGAVRRARVFAFEPESQNYAVLCRNIVENALSDRAVAWSCALSDEVKFDRIHLSQFGYGGSCHAFGEAKDFKLEAANFPFVQGCFSTTLDALVAGGAVPAPHHIKIDVDGFEHKVVNGALQTLRSPTLKSLLIEVNPELAEHRGLIETLKSHGFAFDPAQVARAARAEGAFKGVAEYVFRR